LDDFAEPPSLNGGTCCSCICRTLWNSFIYEKNVGSFVSWKQKQKNRILKNWMRRTLIISNISARNWKTSSHVRCIYVARYGTHLPTKNVGSFVSWKQKQAFKELDEMNFNYFKYQCYTLKGVQSF
jgi:hypothetical protein